METGCGKTTDVIVINDGSVTINEDLDSQASYSAYDDISGLGGIMSYNNLEDVIRDAETYTRNTGPAAQVSLDPNKITLAKKFVYNPLVDVYLYNILDSGGVQGHEFFIEISEHIPLLDRIGEGNYIGPRKITFKLQNGGVFENNSIIESRKNPTWYSQGYIGSKDEEDVGLLAPEDERNGVAQDGDYHLEVSQEEDNALIYLPAMLGGITRRTEPIIGNVFDIGCKLKLTKKGLHPTIHRQGVSVQQYSVTALLNNASSRGETNLGGKFIFTHIT